MKGHRACLLFLACAALATVHALADSNTVETIAAPVAPPVKNLNDSLVIVRGERAAGSGFIISRDDKLYLISNFHVISANLTNNFTTVNGYVLTVSNLEISVGVDLARMAVSGENCRGLKHTKDMEIGDPVYVYGNSQGADVATMLTGTVCGVGPELVEVTAKFVHGNSGSPILDVHGGVIGVATFANLAPPDWLNTNTQFSAVRRYGEKLSSAMAGEWLQVQQSQVFQQTSLLNDLEMAGIRAYFKIEEMNGSLSQARIRELMKDPGIACAFQRESYVDPKWYDAVQKALDQIQIADDMLKGKVSKHDSRVTDALQAFKRDMQKISKDAIQLCDKTPWVKTKLITEQVKELRAFYAPMDTEIDDLWKLIQNALNSSTKDTKTNKKK